MAISSNIIGRVKDAASFLTPLHCLVHISKIENGYLRRLLVVGATSVTRRAPTTDSRTGAWVRSLHGRKPTRLVTVAIANKTARTAWALLAKGETYKATPAT